MSVNEIARVLPFKWKMKTAWHRDRSNLLEFLLDGILVGRFGYLSFIAIYDSVSQWINEEKIKKKYKIIII